MAAKNSPTKKIMDLASRFVKEQDGKWSHDEWEDALKQVEDAGVAAEEEVKRHFGNLLEATKYFYQLETKTKPGEGTPRSDKPGAKVKSRAKAKPVAKAKAKSKAKTKSKSKARPGKKPNTK